MLFAHVLVSPNRQRCLLALSRMKVEERCKRNQLHREKHQFLRPVDDARAWFHQSHKIRMRWVFPMKETGQTQNAGEVLDAFVTAIVLDKPFLQGFELFFAYIRTEPISLEFTRRRANLNRRR